MQWPYQEQELVTFTQRYLLGIANTSFFFNTSEVAKTTTCVHDSDRMPELFGKPRPLAATTAIALGAFPSFSLVMDACF